MLFTIANDHGCIGAMRRRCILSLGLVGFAFPALAEPPRISDLIWHPDDTHCRFVRSETAEPNPAKPESWYYLFVTELVSDDITSTERGYMRLDGRLRELEFVSRHETDSGEVRRYKTFGRPPLTVKVDLRTGESKKSKLGQTVYFKYTGAVTVKNGFSQSLVPFEGSCGVEPDKLN